MANIHEHSVIGTSPTLVHTARSNSFIQYETLNIGVVHIANCTAEVFHTKSADTLDENRDRIAKVNLSATGTTTVQITGRIFNPGDKLYAKSSVATGFTAEVNGAERTNAGVV